MWTDNGTLIDWGNWYYDATRQMLRQVRLITICICILICLLFPFPFYFMNSFAVLSLFRRTTTTSATSWALLAPFALPFSRTIKSSLLISLYHLLRIFFSLKYRTDVLQRSGSEPVLPVLDEPAHHGYSLFLLTSI